MKLPEFNAVFLTNLVIALGSLIGALELLTLRRFHSNTGIWRLKSLRPDLAKLPFAFDFVLTGLFHERVFTALLVLQTMAAAVALFHPHWALHLALLTAVLTTSLRWRGTFNGGSDAMTVIVLAALGLAGAFHDSIWVVQGALWYVAVQATLSYFVAGLVKLREPSWRSGAALPLFFRSYEGLVPSWLTEFVHKPRLARVASWTVMLWECLFPLALLDQRLMLCFLAIGFLFHLGNAIAFGLNRFLFAWIAAYPALYHCSAFGFHLLLGS